MDGTGDNQEDTMPAKTNDTAEDMDEPNISQNKGKGKEPSMLDRIRSSGKAATQALTSTHTNLHGLAGSSTKTGQADTSSSANSYHPFQSTAMDRPVRNEAASNDGTFKQAQAFSGSAESFTEFLGLAEMPSLQNEEAKVALSGDPITKFEAADGAAVMDLLGQPPNFDDEQISDEQGSGLTQQGVEKLREALFDSSSNRPYWDNLLDFTPLSLTGPHDHTGQVESHFGTADVTEARNMWLSQWQNVLSNYTGEVWGDLEPLVSQAKKEVEDSIKGSGSGGEAASGGALERLRMLLAHMRGPD